VDLPDEAVVAPFLPIDFLSHPFYFTTFLKEKVSLTHQSQLLRAHVLLLREALLVQLRQSLELLSQAGVSHLTRSTPLAFQSPETSETRFTQ